MKARNMMINVWEKTTLPYINHLQITKTTLYLWENEIIHINFAKRYIAFIKRSSNLYSDSYTGNMQYKDKVLRRLVKWILNW